MPRGEKTGCRKPGHTERMPRPADGASICVACYNERLLKLRWKTVYKRYLRLVAGTGAETVHHMIREMGIPIRRGTHGN